MDAKSTGRNRMAIVRTQEQMLEIAKETGSKFGYKEVTLEVVAYKDFKMRWTRSYQWINFSVSDYLIGMSQEALTDLFTGMYVNIIGNGMSSFGDSFNSEVTSEEFVNRCRPTYIKRTRGKKETFREFEGITVYWLDSERMSEKASYFSALFKTIFLNARLKDAPEDVIESIIKDNYNSIQEGSQKFGQKVGSAYLTSDEIEKMEEYIRNSGLVM